MHSNSYFPFPGFNFADFCFFRAALKKMQKKIKNNCVFKRFNLNQLPEIPRKNYNKSNIYFCRFNSFPTFVTGKSFTISSL